MAELRRFDPAGAPLSMSAFLFGNEIGEPVKDPKRVWNAVVLKSHGYAPHYTRTGNLRRASRDDLAAIDLHFHDLRREAGSRWLEGGVPLHTVRDWLGLTSIAQTSTYLAGAMKTQHDAMRQFEERRASVRNEIAPDSITGGHERVPSDSSRPKKPRKDTDEHDTRLR